MSAAAVVPFIVKAVTGFVVGKVVGKITGNELLGALAGGFAGGMVGNVGTSAASGLTSGAANTVATEAVTFGTQQGIGGGSIFADMLTESGLGGVQDFFGGGAADALAAGSSGGLIDSSLLTKAGTITSPLDVGVNNAIGGAVEAGGKGMANLFGEAGTDLLNGSKSYLDRAVDAGRDMFDPTKDKKGILEKLLPTGDDAKELLGRGAEEYFKSELQSDQLKELYDLKDELAAEQFARESQGMDPAAKEELLRQMQNLGPAGYSSLGAGTRGYTPRDNLKLRGLNVRPSMANRQNQLDALYRRK